MKHKKILWIDDMQSWSSITAENLKLVLTDYETNLIFEFRPNGEDLIQVFSIIDFDLIVMDYHMSPFTGDKYIKEIREIDHLTTIPILFYSQDNTVNLRDLISNCTNVHVTNRTSVEEMIKKMILRN